MSKVAGKMYSIDELKSLVAPVAESYGVSKVYLFGSAARGDNDENSDYDFCIDKGNMRGLIAFSGFFQDLREAIGRDIDLVTTKNSNKELLKAILSEGIIIYGG